MKKLHSQTEDSLIVNKLYLLKLQIITISISLILISGSLPVYATNAETSNSVDALSYIMKLSLDTKTDSLNEKITMTFRNNTDKAVSKIYIRDMTPAALKYYTKHYSGGEDKLSTQIKSVRLKGSGKELKVKYKKSKTVLVVNLGKKIKPGKKASIVLSMKTDIPKRQDRFGVHKTKKGKLYNLSFCFPYLADNYNGKWNTDPYFDDGESRSSDLADYKVVFKAPKSYMVAATGEESTKKGVTRISARQYRDFAIVACNFMKKESFQVGDITVNNYYLKGKHSKDYRKLSKMVAIDSINLFTEKVGEYNYKELDMTQALFGFGFGGMEYPGLIMINGSAYYSGSGHKLGAQSLAETVAHEIGHQWFYAAVGNREYAEAWIDEGFTTYLEKYIYAVTPCESNSFLREVDNFVIPIESVKKEAADFLEVYKKDYSGMYLNISPSKYPKGRDYAFAEYEGGGIFLFNICEQMGQEKFDSFLKEYYRRYNNKVVKTKDVVQLIREFDGSSAMDEIIRFYIKI
ncbi:MAG: M1 family metallopeptidase [Mogibacterium sp.]|nr:M1 family metallopeptidase [Mogibacterium sp.]